MRDYFLLLILTFGSFLTLATPLVGILLWGWVTMMNAHQLVFGFGRTLPINMIVAVLTMLALLMRPGRKLPPMQALTVVFVVFFVWCNTTTFAALDPRIAWHRWDLAIKSMIFAFFVATILTTPLRVRAMVWIFVISYGYFGVKGGGFTIITGAAGIVVGPPNSTIEDRNHLSVVLLMAMPLMNYLRATSRFRPTQIVLYVAMTLCAIAVIGSFSRGGLIGLIGMGGVLWWWSKNKFALLLAAAGIFAVMVTVMPASWFERMDSIDTAATSDASFQGRLDAWEFAIKAATDRITGVGFSVTENQRIFSQYVGPRESHAAHSIYFQVLGDHGWPGLFMFLTMLMLAWRNAALLARKRNAEVPGLEWAPQLGTMMKVTLVGYGLAGAAVSMAYDSSICALLGILIGARYVMEQRLKEHQGALTPSGRAGTGVSPLARARHPGQLPRRGPAPSMRTD